VFKIFFLFKICKHCNFAFNISLLIKIINRIHSAVSFFSRLSLFPLSLQRLSPSFNDSALLLLLLAIFGCFSHTHIRPKKEHETKTKCSNKKHGQNANKKNKGNSNSRRCRCVAKEERQHTHTHSNNVANTQTRVHARHCENRDFAPLFLTLFQNCAL